MRVLDELYAAVYVTDEDDRVLFANRRLIELIGESGKAPSVPDISARFTPARPETVGTPERLSAHLFAGAEVRDRRDGRWYLVQAGSIPWVDRRRVGLTVMTDVTDQKLARTLRREHQEALHQTSRLVGLAEAATTLAHELNQPLVAIVGYNAACIRLLESEDSDRSELRAAMQKCRAQAARAGDIIHRMRELARRRAPELASCNLNAMVRQTLDWVEEDLVRAGVHIELVLSEPLPPVQADRILIEQVLLNLVQNAIEAMREVGSARRRLRVASAGRADDSVEITVSDQGRGISSAVADRLFTPFFTTKDNGLGLGLSICRSAVEIHGGSIWFSANDDGGRRSISCCRAAIRESGSRRDSVRRR